MPPSNTPFSFQNKVITIPNRIAITAPPIISNCLPKSHAGIASKKQRAIPFQFLIISLICIFPFNCANHLAFFRFYRFEFDSPTYNRNRTYNQSLFYHTRLPYTIIFLSEIVSYYHTCANTCPHHSYYLPPHTNPYNGILDI